MLKLNWFLLISILLSPLVWAASQLDEPLPSYGTFPRISLIAPADTKVSLAVFVDDSKICKVVGKVSEKEHRQFGNQVMVDGVCYGSRIPVSGEHEYRLDGFIVLPSEKQQAVFYKTGKRDVTDVYEPVIEIDSQGRVSISLAVG